MIVGTAYGVVLNDRAEREALGGALGEAPYGEPPRAPVVYIKPRTCLAPYDAPVALPHDVPVVVVGATLALVFGRDVSAGEPAPLAAIGGACLAIDLSEPHASYHRPAIRERCRDGFLPLGAMVTFSAAFAAVEIVTRIDGAVAHRWSLERLVRPIAVLVGDLAAFMTLEAGDLLLVGLAGDAPRAGPGARVSIEAAGLPTLHTILVAERHAA